MPSLAARARTGGRGGGMGDLASLSRARGLPRRARGRSRGVGARVGPESLGAGYHRRVPGTPAPIRKGVFPGHQLR